MRLALLTLLFVAGCAQRLPPGATPPEVAGPAELVRSDGVVLGMGELLRMNPGATVDGIVVVRVGISAAGEVERTEVVRGFGGNIMDEAALRVARRVLYVPARLDGIAVPGMLDVRVVFALR